jgi:hypothetical protein
MGNSTVATVSAAIPKLLEDLAFLSPELHKLGDLVQAFLRQPVTPERTCDFEKGVDETLRNLGRVVLDHVFNRLEPDQLEECPQRLEFAGEIYRRRPKSRNRIGTLFGEIELHRYLYEALEAGEPALFPLELQLGIEAGLATPALAERVGLWSVDHEQQQVLTLLQHDCGFRWSVKSLRKLTASLRDGLASFRRQSQVAKVLELLEKAQASRGKHRPVLAAGRDGVNVPIRGDGYREAATGTLSVLDRRGKRLGTLYLGMMPESGQQTLSDQLTALLTDVLTEWHKRGRPAPRLAYVTDGGHHPEEYYQKVLRRMADPWHVGGVLAWQWIVDYWHGCGYVHELAEGLFGAGARAFGCSRKWRRWLRDRRHGLAQVLRAAMWYLGHGPRRSKAQEEQFWKAYLYLRKHGKWMRYVEYRQQGLPIGSGVTEAACKTVFAERLKRSGMTWGIAGGQVVVDLRVLQLSGVWQATHQAYLGSRPLPRVVQMASHRVGRHQTLKKAA